MKLQYTVPTACEVAGTWRDAGETIEMTAAEAMYLAPPYGAVLERKDADGKLDGNKRRSGRRPQ